MRRRTAQTGSVAVLLALSFACAPPAFAADHPVSASGFSFSPSTVAVTAGDSVTWTNAGGFHNVRFDDGSFVQPPTASSDAWTVSRTFGTAGSFTYYCEAHSFFGMAGTVNVVPAESSSTAVGDETTPGAAPAVGQSKGTVCASKRRFTIRIRGLERVRVKSLRVDFNGKQLPVRTQLIDGQRRRTAEIDMRGFPRGSYTVAIAVTTADGMVLRGIRTYRTCAGKLSSAMLPRL